jgi:uncharacterized protein YndB with AHSA1/START domain
VRIERSVTVARPIEEVFAFVADPRNDPSWCRKVRSVAQLDADRYAVVHRPVPWQRPRRMQHTRVSADPPRRIVWHEDDGVDEIEVTYQLEPVGEGATRLRQVDEATLGGPPVLRPLLRVGIGADVARQLRALKRLLERNGRAEAPAG